MDLKKEREAFEAWFESRYDAHFMQFALDLDMYADKHTQTCWEAWQAAKAIPEGFVVVPKEPTQELLNKMQDFFVGAFENGLTGGQSIHCAYIAMIEAAQEQAND